jgi:hypothetical protein
VVVDSEGDTVGVFDARIWAAAGEQDARLKQFRRKHPEVRIITTRGLPKAWVGGEEITRATVSSLLNKLEEMTGTQR